MKRTISIGLNIASLVFILTAANFWNNLMIFLLAGVIPGTSVAISPLAMLVLTILFTIGLSLAIIHTIDPEEDSKNALPKKRYSRL